MPYFFLEFFLHQSPVAYGAPTDLESSSFSIQSFCLFILFLRISRQEYWSGLPFPSPVDHILSDFSTMICPTWEAPQGLAKFHWVRQVCGSSVIRLTRFLWLWFQCVFPLMMSCNTYRLTWVSLTLDMGYVLTAAPAKCSHCSLPWTRYISSLPPILNLNVE